MVKIKTNYKEFREILDELIIVYKSRSILERDKVVIFEIKGQEVILYAFALGVSARRVVDSSVFEVRENIVDEPQHYQIPLTLVDDFLTAYSNGRGIPKDVVIDFTSDHEVIVEVTEELEIAGKKENQKAVAVITTYPVRNTVLRNVELLDVVNGLEVKALTEETRTSISKMISDILPYLPEKMTGDLALSVDGDYVQCNNQALLVRYENRLKDLLERGGLSVHALNVISGILALQDDITYVQSEETKSLVFRTNELLMAVNYAVELRVYPQDFFALISDDNYLVVPKVDLNEVIGRMSVFERNIADGKVVIVTDKEKNRAKFSTNNYAQPINLVGLESKGVGNLPGGLVEFPININLAYLQSLMLGRSTGYAANLRLTIQPHVANKYFLRADDESGIWSIIMMVQ